MNELKILFEDEHLICVVKPFGVLAQGNDSTHSLCDDISAYLKTKGEKGEVYVVHRLDKTTGGVMVFAKTKQTAGKLCELIAQNKLSKTYHAVVCGQVNSESSVYVDLLYHDKGKNKTYVVKRERKGVKKAELSFVVLNSAVYNDAVVTKVEVHLHTGRTHQIRVQFAHRKTPLVGDRKYGATVSDKTIALWSREISFSHPITSELVKVTADTDVGAFSAF